MAHFTKKPLTNYEVRLEIEKIYERHAKAYQSKHRKPFCNVATDKGYTQQVTPNVSRDDVEWQRRGCDSYAQPYDVLIFAFSPDGNYLFNVKGKPIWWHGGVVIITRRGIKWTTPLSPLSHYVTLDKIRCFAPIPTNEQGELQDNKILLCYRDSNKQDSPSTVHGFPSYFIDFLNEALRFLQANPPENATSKQSDITALQVTPPATKYEAMLPRRLTDEEIIYGVSAIYRKYELFYMEKRDLDFSEPENSYRIVRVVPNIPKEWERFGEYIEYMAPTIKPEDVLIFAYSNYNTEFHGPGGGVLITRRKIYWMPFYSFKPSKYSENLSAIKCFAYEENPKTLFKTYETFIRRKNSACTDASQESAIIYHFSKHHIDFLNEVLTFLQSNP